MYNKLCFDDGSALVKARSYTRVRAEADKRKPATAPEHKPVRVIDRRPDEAALPGLAPVDLEWQILIHEAESVKRLSPVHAGFFYARIQNLDQLAKDLQHNTQGRTQ